MLLYGPLLKEEFTCLEIFTRSGNRTISKQFPWSSGILPCEADMMPLSIIGGYRSMTTKISSKTRQVYFEYLKAYSNIISKQLLWLITGQNFRWNTQTSYGCWWKRQNFKSQPGEARCFLQIQHSSGVFLHFQYQRFSSTDKPSQPTSLAYYVWWWPNHWFLFAEIPERILQLKNYSVFLFVNAAFETSLKKVLLTSLALIFSSATTDLIQFTRVAQLQKVIVL